MKYGFLALLAVQLVVQTGALVVLLRRAGKEENQLSVFGAFLRAFVISLGSVILEFWLHESLGVWVVVMVLGMPVMVLMRQDWAIMRYACVVTIGLSMTVLLLAADFDSWFMARFRVEVEEAGKDASGMSYAQIANKLDFSGARLARPPEVIQPPGPTGTAVLAAANLVSVTTNTEPSASAPDGAQAVTSGPVPDWDAARREIRFGGRMRRGGGQIVALVNDEVCATNDVFTTRCGLFAYRWRVNRILQGDVVLDKMDARIVENASVPP